jgi:transposase
MKDSNLYLGLDVHGREIMAAVVDAEGAERYLGVIPNRPESVRKLVSKRGAKERIRAVYEAGPTDTGCPGSWKGWGYRARYRPTLVPSSTPPLSRT